MAKTTVNKFKTAVEATPDIQNCYQLGLRALGKYSSKVSLGDTSQCNGSVDIDACVTAKYPTANRWDYCFSYKDEVYFVEVHSAYTSEVGTVIKKLQWLKDWLISQAPEINKLKAKKPFYWIQSGRYDILPTSSQARLVALQGIKPIAKLTLP